MVPPAPPPPTITVSLHLSYTFFSLCSKQISILPAYASLGERTQSTHRVAIATFWRSLHHDVNQPSLVRLGGARPPPSGLSAITSKVVMYAPAERADPQTLSKYPYFSSTPICTLWERRWSIDKTTWKLIILFEYCIFPVRPIISQYFRNT